MISTSRSARRFFTITGMMLCCGTGLSFGQVNPMEIRDPQLKALEQTHLGQLIAANREIAGIRFPFQFLLSRYVGLDPKEQLGADTRGLEFVKFNERTLLKVTGNYSAAYNAGVLTQNQLAGKVMEEVIVPALRVVSHDFSGSEDFSAFGFEISFHVRRSERSYDYEGKEILVVVLSRGDAAAYLKAQQDSERQEILDRSEIYLNGKPYGLTLGERDPFPASRKQDAVVKTAYQPAPATTESSLRAPLVSRKLLPPPPPTSPAPVSVQAALPAAPAPAPVAAATQAEAGALQTKYQSELDGLSKEGREQFHFVDYAPPEFVIFRNQAYLQMTLRNPAAFDKDGTSIYKRAARTFDLFLAPALKAILTKVPADPQLAGLDITVLVGTSTPAGASSTSEALEFLCPAQLARRFAEAEITNQELIDRSVILVNGVRIALNLQVVE